MPDIKSMLNDIIDGANNKFPNSVNSTMHQNMGVQQPQTFDAGKFREKLSMYVLKDIISAMMHDDTKDIDGMIDQSIMQHIRDEYGCGCYDYLRRCCKNSLKGGLIEDIVQEIDDKTEKVTEKVSETQDDAFTSDMENMEKELPNIKNYEQLREELRKLVSDKVVNDVAKEIVNKNAPTFDNVDKALAVQKTDSTNTAADENDTEGADVQSESVCMNICHKIMTEAAVRNINITMEQALELSFIEFCMSEMDYLFRMDPTKSRIDKWQQPRPIQESFFDRLVQEQEDPKLAAERERYAAMFAKSKGVQPVKEEDEEYSDDFSNDE